MVGTATIFVGREPGNKGGMGPKTGFCEDSGGLRALHTGDLIAPQEQHAAPSKTERAEPGSPGSQDPE